MANAETPPNSPRSTIPFVPNSPIVQNPKSHLNSNTHLSYLNFTDPSNPFRLDHGDNPTITLVPNLLTSDNYATWYRAMRRALRAKNKLGFILGTLLKPTSPTDPLFDLWERCNDLIVSWIQNSISPSLKSSVAFVNDAKELWQDLYDRFSQQNGYCIFQLKRDLANLLQERDSVSIYFGKLKSVWDELSIYDPFPSCTCGTLKTLMDRYQRDCVLQFLMGQTMALAVKKPFPSSKYSPKQNPNPKKDRPYCTHCKISGHSMETCFKLGNVVAPVCSTVTSLDIPLRNATN
ncbi:uncharacterized protein LOC116137632 [Pistacia vera]|uniref:uncharacterized protein LOC116137632 n=1 Tax=Pistacia vera TaxID=55513 RepID=UPI001263D68C|nr:uncharacterized protein LOC116137632 [Pistacia vera]